RRSPAPTPPRRPADRAHLERTALPDPRRDGSRACTRRRPGRPGGARRRSLLGRGDRGRVRPPSRATLREERQGRQDL
ncbi:MAG: hypothetical protein AVDCRST_MAG90-1886, partial [uncultured Microvirga sp.]